MLSILNSVLKSVREEFQNRFNILHEYPELPKVSLAEDSFPLQIGSNITASDYNAFLDQIEKTGYKFHWNGGDVFIIDMANREHEAVISYLQDCFKEPNNGVKRGPIKVYGQPYHYNPIGHGDKIAPDLAVCPDNTHVAQPLTPYPGPPPGDVNRRPHGRIICEVANTQKIVDWETRCESWMHEQYVRCVLGVKFDDIRSFQGNVHRSMIAKLWTRQALPGSVLSTDTILATNGVYVKQWDFGTLLYGTNTATGCNTNNLIAYQVTILFSDAFWDPPIVGGAPNVVEYTVTVPGTVGTILVNNFVIDLFDVQQEVLSAQKV